jgi:hypothetical protein
VVIFVRRTSSARRVMVLGYEWRVGRAWAGRLVRAEVGLGDSVIRCVGLRRCAPDVQPLLAEWPYDYPRANLTC